MRLTVPTRAEIRVVSGVTGATPGAVDPVPVGFDEGEESMSMLRSRFRAAFAAIALLGLCSTGCELRAFRVQLPGFETAEVLGLWVWRASPQTGEFERYAQIEFGTVVDGEGHEFLPYSLTIAGSPATLYSLVTREPTAPDDVVLHLSFGSALGTFKLSSYNAAGESPLSAGTLVY